MKKIMLHRTGNYDDIGKIQNFPIHNSSENGYSYTTSEEVAKILAESIKEPYPERKDSEMQISTSDDMRHMGEVFA